MAHEYVELKATLHSLDDKRYDCGACLSTYKGRTDEEQMTGILKKQKGCSEAYNEPIHAIEEVIKFKNCIGNYVSSSSFHWIEMHSHFSRGILPFPGSLSDQPSKAIEVFNVIDSHKASVAMRQAQEHARRASSIGRGKRGR